jgi:hypothetical protein
MASSTQVLQFFAWEGFTGGYREVAKDFHTLAFALAQSIPDNELMAHGFLRLLEARDAIMRGMLQASTQARAAMPKELEDVPGLHQMHDNSKPLKPSPTVEIDWEVAERVKSDLTEEEKKFAQLRYGDPLELDREAFMRPEPGVVNENERMVPRWGETAKVLSEVEVELDPDLSESIVLTEIAETMLVGEDNPHDLHEAITDAPEPIEMDEGWKVLDNPQVESRHETIRPGAFELPELPTEAPVRKS